MIEQIGHVHTGIWILENLHRLWLWLHGVNLKVQDVYPECTELSNTNIIFKSKLRIVLTNRSKHLLIISAAQWDQRREGVPIQPKETHPSHPQENYPASSLQVESSAGW